MRPGAGRMDVGAGGKAAKPLDPMDETVGGEKVERAIDHRRLAAEPGRGQPVEELVGGHRLVALEQGFEHEGPRRGQPQPPRRTRGLGGGKRVAAAPAVVMGREGPLGIA